MFTDGESEYPSHLLSGSLIGLVLHAAAALGPNTNTRTDDVTCHKPYCVFWKVWLLLANISTFLPLLMRRVYLLKNGCMYVSVYMYRREVEVVVCDIFFFQAEDGIRDF